MFPQFPQSLSFVNVQKTFQDITKVIETYRACPKFSKALDVNVRHTHHTHNVGETRLLVHVLNTIKIQCRTPFPEHFLQDGEFKFSLILQVSQELTKISCCRCRNVLTSTGEQLPLPPFQLLVCFGGFVCFWAFLMGLRLC